MKRIAAIAVFVVLLPACTSSRLIRRVQEFRALRERGDDAASQAFLTSDAKMFFNKREGEGSPIIGGPWRHWDTYFHGHASFTDWSSHDRVVTAIGHETNDYYRLLDWKPSPWRMTWWLDESDKISAILLEPLEKSTSRLEEFVAWAKKNHPDELAYLMPKGEIDPTGDRPERWRPILI